MGGGRPGAGAPAPWLAGGLLAALLLAGAVARAAPPAPAPRPSASASAEAAAPPAPARSPIAQELADLARLGLVDVRTGTPQTLEAELLAAEGALERGDLAGAAATLYGIAESPRYADFSDTLPYQNAEYDLVVALAGGGAHDAALALIERVLRRGPKAAYYGVAHRRAVDLALETRRYADVLARLAAIPASAPLPREAEGERGYLAGRAAYDAGDLDRADKELTQVSRKSRLFSSALYLRGVLRVRQGKLKEALETFCEITRAGDDDRFGFYVDDRYFGLRDLAQLGAGRVAHEEKRYDDAYYHYFQVPDDSDRLPEALFEAAWSMYQKRELRTARELVAELLKTFPASPLVPEALLLAGYLELADCKFEEARKKLDLLAADVRPLVEVLDKARASVESRRQLLGRALARAARRGPAAAAPAGASPEDRVLALLRLDPALVRLSDAVAGLRREAAVAPRVIDEWRDLGYRIASRKGQVAGASDDASRATVLVGELRRLRAELRREKTALLAGASGDRTAAAERLPQLDAADAQLATLEERAGQAAALASAGADPELRARLAAELDAATRLAERTRALAEGWDRAVDAFAVRELLRVENELVRIIEKARLGKVDAVIGEKRLLEREIEDLAADRYLPHSIGRVFQQGLISDTEEYWPPEEEIWPDEFRGWK